MKRPLSQRAFILPIMKKLLALVFLLSPLTFAASPRQIVESARPLIAAVGALPGIQNVSSFSAYLPGYGLQINGWAAVPELGDSYEEALMSLQDILVGLSQSVQGLNEDDWVSVALDIIGTLEPREVLVRIKPGQPETLEIWIDGVKQ